MSEITEVVELMSEKFGIAVENIEQFIEVLMPEWVSMQIINELGWTVLGLIMVATASIIWKLKYKKFKKLKEEGSYFDDSEVPLMLLRVFGVIGWVVGGLLIIFGTCCMLKWILAPTAMFTKSILGAI